MAGRKRTKKDEGAKKNQQSANLLFGVDLTVRELMILFNVSRQTIWAWRLHHGLPYKQIRGYLRDNIRFDYQEVLDWAYQTQTPVVGRSQLIDHITKQINNKEENEPEQ